MKVVHGYEMTIGTVPIRLAVSRYPIIKQTACTATCTDTLEPYGKLTVCVMGPTEPQTKDEIFVKTWSKNAKFAEAVLAEGLFVDTGRRINVASVSVQVWRLAEGASWR